MAEEAIIVPLDIRKVGVVLIGDSPLICHKWSEKAKLEMLGKMTKAANAGRAKKDPDAEYKASLYLLPDGSGYGFPAGGVKAAMVRGAKQIEGLTMVDARTSFFVQGEVVKHPDGSTRQCELVRIHGTPIKREDVVVIGGRARTVDLRYRGEFPTWKATFNIEYNAKMVSFSLLAQMLKIAGFGVGLGEWRPERDGDFGRFHQAETQAEMDGLPNVVSDEQLKEAVS